MTSLVRQFRSQVVIVQSVVVRQTLRNDQKYFEGVTAARLTEMNHNGGGYLRLSR